MVVQYDQMLPDRLAPLQFYRPFMEDTTAYILPTVAVSYLFANLDRVYTCITVAII